MSDRPSVRPASDRGRWVVASVLAWLLYLVSIGPAIALQDRGVLSERVFAVIYAPFIWACRLDENLRHPLQVYGFWCECLLF